MVGYLDHVTLVRQAVRVERFGLPNLALVDEPIPRGRNRVIVRVTHASVGVTDVVAARGDYLLHPLSGFVPGYDFVGTIEHLPTTVSRLRVGHRVAGILPAMGSHASYISVAPSLLVPVPGGLDSLTAATMPLDAVAAMFALDELGRQPGKLLIQGVGGAVGAWAAQLASACGHEVYGTASARSRTHAERFAATVFDYHDPDWPDQVLDVCGGRVDAAIDHTGSAQLRRIVRPEGRIVRTAFGGQPGHERAATAKGFLSTMLRRNARPAERVCSAPMLVATQRARYRSLLATAFKAVCAGTLAAPRPHAVALSDFRDAYDACPAGIPGEKTILVFPQ